MKRLIAALCALLLFVTPALAEEKTVVDSVSFFEENREDADVPREALDSAHDAFFDMTRIRKVEFVMRSGKTRELTAETLWEDVVLPMIVGGMRLGDTLRQLVFQPSVIVSAALEDEDSVLNLQDIVITGSDGEEHWLSVGEFERNIADNAARLSRTLRDGMTELRDRAVLGAEELAEYWKNAFEQARADLRAAWESVEEAVSGAIDAAGQAVQGAMDDVGAALRDAEDDLKGLWNSLWGN